MGRDEGDIEVSQYTDVPHGDSVPPASGGGGRRADRRAPRRRRSPIALVVVLLVLVLAVGGLYWGGKQGADFLRSLVGSSQDYSGPGTGEVLFEVEQGDTATVIGRGLAEQDVVGSVDAFIDAAQADPASSGIQVGSYAMKRQMSAADALAVLVDPKNRVQNTVTIPEGLRVVDVVEILADKTEFSGKDIREALKDPAIGLPEWAEGNPEGYLFPATYEVGPQDAAVDIVTAMVDRWRQAADQADLETRADELGRTPAELMTIASLIQAEGRGEAMPKVSRVIWNRLDGPGNKGGTYGMLQIDAAVNYALGEKGIVRLTTAEIDEVAESPYNTYTQVGLPPTPINSPGDDAIEAATNPAEGPWYYYVTVDLKTGETKFTDSYDEFLQFKREFNAYCDANGC